MRNCITCRLARKLIHDSTNHRIGVVCEVGGSLKTPVFFPTEDMAAMDCLRWEGIINDQPSVVVSKDRLDWRRYHNVG